MITLEEFIESRTDTSQLELFKEAEELRLSGILPETAFSRKIAEKFYKKSNVLDLLKVHTEVYRAIALKKVYNE